jgi:ArsR family transcriptional regulator, virulence genes transcriptional regulator
VILAYIYLVVLSPAPAANLLTATSYIHTYEYMNIKIMRKKADEVSALLKILSHPKRLLILCQLVERERAVGELAEQLGVREAAISQQLALLRKDRLVKARRDGRTIFYSLARPDLSSLIEFLYATYCKQT